MIRLIQWLIWGHIHKWNTIFNTRLTLVDSKMVGTRYILRCDHCGNIKKVDLI